MTAKLTIVSSATPSSAQAQLARAATIEKAVETIEVSEGVEAAVNAQMARLWHAHSIIKLAHHGIVNYDDDNRMDLQTAADFALLEAMEVLQTAIANLEVRSIKLAIAERELAEASDS